jgi:hypothetical protein
MKWRRQPEPAYQMLHNSESECSSPFLSDTGDDIVCSVLLAQIYSALTKVMLALKECKISQVSRMPSRCCEMTDKFEDQNFWSMSQKNAVNA